MVIYSAALAVCSSAWLFTLAWLSRLSPFCFKIVQVSPQLEGSDVLRVESALSGMTSEGVQTAYGHWHKADTYYYMSIARMQRLWEVKPSLFIFGFGRVCN